VSLTKKGISGAAEIKQIMIDLRENPVTELDGEKVIRIEDYANATARNLNDGSTEKMDIPTSNVLIYYTDKGTKMAARPSGTEPKIKFYFSVNTDLERTEDFTKKEKELDRKLDAIVGQLDLN
ncbi:MAG: phospho-sugar mutase, partial [Cyclobacteriaceae bacterium]